MSAERVVEDNAEYQIIETTSSAGSTLETRWKPGSEGAAQQEREQQFAALREKARKVYRGEDTFTAAQIQKLLAALVWKDTG